MGRADGLYFVLVTGFAGLVVLVGILVLAQALPRIADCPQEKPCSNIAEAE